MSYEVVMADGRAYPCDSFGMNPDNSVVTIHGGPLGGSSLPMSNRGCVYIGRPRPAPTMPSTQGVDLVRCPRCRARLVLDVTASSEEGR